MATTTRLYDADAGAGLDPAVLCPPCSDGGSKDIPHRGSDPPSDGGESHDDHTDHTDDHGGYLDPSRIRRRSITESTVATGVVSSYTSRLLRGEFNADPVQSVCGSSVWGAGTAARQASIDPSTGTRRPTVETEYRPPMTVREVNWEAMEERGDGKDDGEQEERSRLEEDGTIDGTEYGGGEVDGRLVEYRRDPDGDGGGGPSEEEEGDGGGRSDAECDDEGSDMPPENYRALPPPRLTSSMDPDKDDGGGNDHDHNDSAALVVRDRPALEPEEVRLEPEQSCPPPVRGGTERGSRQLQQPLSKSGTKQHRSEDVVRAIQNQLALVSERPTQKFGGYKHTFITVKDEHRFQILYTFLKRNTESKVVIFFSTTKSTQYYAKLLDRLKFDVRSVHNGQSRSTFLTEFLAFGRQRSGILCLPDFQANDLAIPPTVTWLVQFEPPGDPTEYIFRVSRISSENAGSAGRALLFLTPAQYGFLQYYKAAGVKYYEYEMHAVSNVQRDLVRLVRKDARLRRYGAEAYRSYMVAYAGHGYRDIYNVHGLREDRVALAFGFAEPPSEEDGRDRGGGRPTSSGRGATGGRDKSKERDERGSRGEPPQSANVRRASTREERRWRPNRSKKEGWTTRESKSWRYADRHAEGADGGGGRPGRSK